MKIITYQPDESGLAYAVGTTLDRFIKLKQDDFPFASGELSQLLRDIALAAKIVNRETMRAGLSNIGGSFGQVNILRRSTRVGAPAGLTSFNPNCCGFGIRSFVIALNMPARELFQS